MWYPMALYTVGAVPRSNLSQARSIDRRFAWLDATAEDLFFAIPSVPACGSHEAETDAGPDSAGARAHDYDAIAAAPPATTQTQR